MASTKRKTKDQLQSLLNGAIERHGVPGATLAIWRDGALDAVSSGVLSVDTGEPVRVDSLFQIGSVQKVLTATLVMRLRDEGMIDLEAPVRTYLPEFRLADLGASKEITVRQLLCHVSGIDGDFMTDTGNGADRLARYLDRCALLPLSHPVGKGFSYSNAAFTIAGRIVEVMSRRSFDSALRHYIFEPLGLKNSLSDPLEAPGRSVSAGHVFDPDAPQRSKRMATLYTLFTSGVPAGSTTLMSAEDLVSFSRMHLGNGIGPNGTRILSADSVAAMQEPQVKIPTPWRGIAEWGLGWFFVVEPGGRMLGHDGATIGQWAYLRIHKESGTVVVLMANGGAANDMMMEIFAEVLDPLTGIRPSPPPTAVAAPDRLERYAGTYRNVGGEATYWVEGGQLKRRGFKRIDDMLIEEPEATLNYAGNDMFIWQQPPLKYPVAVTFLSADADGRPQATFAGLRVLNRVR